LLQAVVLLLSVLVVNGIVRQAESTYLEGVLLIASYLIIAVAFSYRSVKPDFGMLLKSCDAVCPGWDDGSWHSEGHSKWRLASPPPSQSPEAFTLEFP
jgi:hypothetical protein